MREANPTAPACILLIRSQYMRLQSNLYQTSKYVFMPTEKRIVVPFGVYLYKRMTSSWHVYTNNNHLSSSSSSTSHDLHGVLRTAYVDVT